MDRTTREAEMHAWNEARESTERWLYNHRDDIAALIKVVQDTSACEVIHGGRPSGFTCLDYEAEAKQHPERFGDPLLTRLRKGLNRCPGCERRAVLEKLS